MSQAIDKQSVQDKEGSAPTTEAQPQSQPEAVPQRRTRAFRQELLARLPMLSAPKWETIETLNVYQEMQGLVDLDADAFLEPLESLAEVRHD